MAEEMTTKEAIEVQITLLAAPILKKNKKIVKSLKLGIEALREKLAREKGEG